MENEYDIQEILRRVLAHADSDAVEELDVDMVRSFDESGVLTRNAGLVIKLASGARFQITIVKC